MSLLVRPTVLVGLLAFSLVVTGAWLSRVPVVSLLDPMLLILLAASVRGGLMTGVLLGAAAGYLRDLTSGGPLGLFTCAYLAVGMAAGSAIAVLDYNQRSVPAAVAALATLALHWLVGVIVATTDLADVVWITLMQQAVLAAAINAAFARPVDRLVQRAEQVARRQRPARAIGYRVAR